MSFTFTPKSDQELTNLLEIGHGDFEVLGAEHKISKNGNPMIELKLKVWDSKGRSKVIYDNLMNMESFEWKIKHFCEAAGLMDQYSRGALTNDDICPPQGQPRTGKLKIGIFKDKEGAYPDKNMVVDYLKSAASSTIKKTNDFDDDLPF